MTDDAALTWTGTPGDRSLRTGQIIHYALAGPAWHIAERLAEIIEANPGMGHRRKLHGLRQAAPVRGRTPSPVQRAGRGRMGGRPVTAKELVQYFVICDYCQDRDVVTAERGIDVNKLETKRIRVGVWPGTHACQRCSKYPMASGEPGVDA